MRKDKLDELIEYTYKTNKENISDIENIEIPKLDKILNRFEVSANEKSTEKTRNKTFILRKTLGFTAVLLVVLFSATLLSEVPQVRAFKFNLVKSYIEFKNDTKSVSFSNSDTKKNSSNTPNKNYSGKTGDLIEMKLSLDEAQKKVNFNILKPIYVPKGYNIKSVKLYIDPADHKKVEQIYSKSETEILIITQSEIAPKLSEKMYVNDNAIIKDITLNNEHIKLVTDNSSFTLAVWFNDRFKFNIDSIGNLNEEEIINIIKQLK